MQDEISSKNLFYICDTLDRERNNECDIVYVNIELFIQFRAVSILFYSGFIDRLNSYKKLDIPFKPLKVNLEIR